MGAKRKGKQTDSKQANGKRRRPSGSMLLRMAVIAFAVYAGVSILNLQTEVASSRQELEDLMEQSERQAKANLELEMQISEGDDEDYIVRQARKELDFVYPYEKVFINASGS